MASLCRAEVRGMMQKSSQGWIFLIVLFFLHLFSFMSLYSLTILSLTFKMNHHIWQQQMELMDANHILSHLESRLLVEDAHCVLPFIPSREVQKKSISWWKQSTCHDNLGGSEYFYFIEHVGNDACGLIEKLNGNQVMAADYYRITLALFRFKKILLQSTFAKSQRVEFSGHDEVHKIIVGRQMWREL